MEEIMETAVIDRQGRLVIPVRARRAASLNTGAVTLIAARGEIILRPCSTSWSIEEWKNTLLAKSPKIKSVKRITDKWMSEEYARRKLGL